MIRLLLFISFLITNQVFAQDLDSLIEKLDSKSYHSRESACTNITELIKKDKESFLKVKKLYKSKDLSLDQREGVKSALTSFYEPANILVPIWAMPDEYRFKDGKDIALHYYEIAQIEISKENDQSDNYNVYNHRWIMRSATRLYLFKSLESFEISRRDLVDLGAKMHENWRKEQRGVHRYVQEGIDDNCSCGYYGSTFKRTEIPWSFKERMESINKALNEDPKPYQYNTTIPKGAIVDDDEDFDCYYNECYCG